LEFFLGDKSIGISTFSLDDARRAGLTSNPTWKSYPRNMLFARALSNGARWFCPDVFNGPVYTPEELAGKDERADRNIVDAVVIEPPAENSATKDPIAQLVSATGTDVHKFFEHYSVNDFSELSPTQRAEATTILTARMKS
jgi:hypothetical protein